MSKVTVYCILCAVLVQKMFGLMVNVCLNTLLSRLSYLLFSILATGEPLQMAMTKTSVFKSMLENCCQNFSHKKSHEV